MWRYSFLILPLRFRIYSRRCPPAFLSPRVIEGGFLPFCILNFCFRLCKLFGVVKPWHFIERKHVCGRNMLMLFPTPDCLQQDTCLLHFVARYLSAVINIESFQGRVMAADLSRWGGFLEASLMTHRSNRNLFEDGRREISPCRDIACGSKSQTRSLPAVQLWQSL